MTLYIDIYTCKARAMLPRMGALIIRPRDLCQFTRTTCSTVVQYICRIRTTYALTLRNVVVTVTVVAFTLLRLYRYGATAPVDCTWHYGARPYYSRSYDGTTNAPSVQ